jgi:hypothetical protein
MDYAILNVNCFVNYLYEKMPRLARHMDLVRPNRGGETILFCANI